MVEVLDAVSAFLDRLTSVDPLPAALAVAAHLLRLGATSAAWRSVLAAAYPDVRVPRAKILGAYVAGVGINAVVPVRAGDAVRIVLAHRAVPGSTYTTVVSTNFVLSIFDMTMVLALFAWATATQDLPGIDVLPDLRTFDYSWLFANPLPSELVLAALLGVAVVLGVWIHRHVVDFWDRVQQGFTVVRTPSRYLRTVVPWQAADWALRFVTIWLLLDAFDVAQSARNVLLVQVSSSLSTLVPVTPSGIGTEQAFLVYLFGGSVPASQLLAFSVGTKLTLVATNVVAGLVAILLTLRTVRFERALRDPA
jgi:uncharacterized membrane protein YbhN (UPF0104 family)